MNKKKCNFKISKRNKQNQTQELKHTDSQILGIRQPDKHTHATTRTHSKDLGHAHTHTHTHTHTGVHLPIATEKNLADDTYIHTHTHSHTHTNMHSLPGPLNSCSSELEVTAVVKLWALKKAFWQAFC